MKQELDLQFEKSGTGPALIFLHGFTFDKRIFHPLIKKLQTKYTIYNINLPGVMESEKPEDLSFKFQGEVIANFIKSQNIKQPALFGHSMGGYIGLEVLKNHEDILAGFGLFHSHPFQDSAQKRKERAKSIDFIKKHGTALLMKKMIPDLFSDLYAKTHVFLIDTLIQVAARISEEVVIGHLQGMIDRADHSETLKNTKLPIMTLAGKQDVAVTEDQWREAALLPKISKLAVIDNCVHMAMYEQTNEAAKEIVEFVQMCKSI